MSNYLTGHIKKANEDLRIIEEEIKGLSCYLVISSNLGQCRLTDNLEEIFKSFPRFFKETDKYKEAVMIYKQINEEKKNKEKQKKLRKRLSQIIYILEPSSENYIEFRFESLNTELIRVLKHHNLVEQPEYMMRDAYIRVVYKKLNFD